MAHDQAADRHSHGRADIACIVSRGFPSIFETPEGSSYPPIATDLRLTAGRACRIRRGRRRGRDPPFDLNGDINALGFRFEAFAYPRDVKRIPEASRPYLEGLEVWIIDLAAYLPPKAAASS